MTDDPEARTHTDSGKGSTGLLRDLGSKKTTPPGPVVVVCAADVDVEGPSGPSAAPLFVSLADV